MVFVSAIIGYVALVLIWFLLAAMLNPNVIVSTPSSLSAFDCYHPLPILQAYLPYAAAAATFIAFVSTKAHQFKSAQAELKAAIIDFVKKKIKTLIGGSFLVGFGVNPDEIVNEAVDGNLKSAVVAVASQKVRSILYTTPLGDMANQMGLDPETLTLLVPALWHSLIANKAVRR